MSTLPGEGQTASRAAVLRLATDDVRTEQGRSRAQPETRAAAHARDGDRGAGSAPRHASPRPGLLRGLVIAEIEIDETIMVAATGPGEPGPRPHRPEQELDGDRGRSSPGLAAPSRGDQEEPLHRRQRPHCRPAVRHRTELGGFVHDAAKPGARITVGLL